MAMATMAARKEKLRLHQQLTLMLTLRLTPGTTMVMPDPTPMVTMATTDPTMVMAMATGAARRGRLRLLLKLTPMPTPKLTPGTTMAMPTGPTPMATMATAALATMLPLQLWLWLLGLS